MDIKYTASSEELAKAWFEYKAKYTGINRVLSLKDFAAGWNAAWAVAKNITHTA